MAGHTTSEARAGVGGHPGEGGTAGLLQGIFEPAVITAVESAITTAADTSTAHATTAAVERAQQLGAVLAGENSVEGATF